MGADAYEPSLWAYVDYLVGFSLRYLTLAGGLYWILQRAFRSRWLGFRIQHARPFPSGRTIAYEIRWSLVNACASGASMLVTYLLIREGHSAMYFGLAEYGWPYLGISALLCFLGYDTWIYWQHRWLHTPWLFRHVHSVHHHVEDPTPFAAFAHHPVETLMGNVYFVLFVVYVPIHPLALAAAGGVMFLIGLNAHSGYEFYPRGFTRHPLFQWINTSTHHNMHHSHTGCHYGNWFNYWDRLMGTNHPDYHATFAAVKTRAAARAAERSAAAEALERAA